MIKHFLIILSLFVAHTAFAAEKKESIKTVVDEVINPLMLKQEIPGMAVGLILKGKIHIFNYGISSKESKAQISDSTLFEIGSISKTFSTLLAAIAEENKKINLYDTVEKYLPELKNTEVGKIQLINLTTHVTGGFPVQIPDNLKSQDELISYFRHWKPTYPPETQRTYANPSIGLLGMVLAKSMNSNFANLIDKEILKKLSMNQTHIDIPSNRLTNYAQGYTRANKPARLSPGLLATESYGIKTTINDMVKFLEANLLLKLTDSKLQHTIKKTHEGFYRIGPMTQLMIWEQYDYPTKLEDLLHGNSAEITMKPNPVVKISPPLKAQDNVLINKTGSTNGFGAYMVFIPNLKSGMVLLANKNYPNEERIKTAYEILTRLLK